MMLDLVLHRVNCHLSCKVLAVVTALKQTDDEGAATKLIKLDTNSISFRGGEHRDFPPTPDLDFSLHGFCT